MIKNQIKFILLLSIFFIQSSLPSFSMEENEHEKNSLSIIFVKSKIKENQQEFTVHFTRNASNEDEINYSKKEFDHDGEYRKTDKKALLAIINDTLSNHIIGYSALQKVTSVNFCFDNISSLLQLKFLVECIDSSSDFDNGSINTTLYNISEKNLPIRLKNINVLPSYNYKYYPAFNNDDNGKTQDEFDAAMKKYEEYKSKIRK